ncbi:unnamed protein product, partial [Mesorhabditis spiculigera]
MEAELRGRWNDLTPFMAEEARERWWARIYGAYAARSFRDVAHLNLMFQQYDKHKDLIKERYGFAFAVFFMNVAYDPRNEQCWKESVEMVKEFGNSTTFDQQGYVVDIITSSASSSGDGTTDLSTPGGDDVHYLIDFDSAYLASAPEDYDRYVAGIRAESMMFDDEEFLALRKKLLTMFMRLPYIYMTQPMRDTCEEKARDNITREIEVLNTGKLIVK